MGYIKKGERMIKRKGLNYMTLEMEISPHVRDKDWTGERDKWLEFNVCMIDNEKWEPHFNIRLSGQTIEDKHIAEEVSIRQLIDLHSFIGCVLKMRENK